MIILFMNDADDKLIKMIIKKISEKMILKIISSKISFFWNFVLQLNIVY